jgi:8-oxo-dGTP pyrophosphatase MutT (NUDIX family)
MAQTVPQGAKMAAGILPFFNNWSTVLLGREYRERTNGYYWMEFGGKVEKGETLAQTAAREACEETSWQLRVPIEELEQAEKDGHYVDHYNDKTNMFYRMYCINIEGDLLDLQTFRDNVDPSVKVEKVDWKYFPSRDVIFTSDTSLPGTEFTLYDTMSVRLQKLRDNTNLNKKF